MNNIYCNHCGISLLDFEIERMCEKNSDPICDECDKKEIQNKTQTKLDITNTAIHDSKTDNN